MKVLDRYLLAQCVPSLGLALVVLTFVMVTHRLFMLSDLVVARGVPLVVVLQLLGLGLPALLPLLVPVSLLVALLLTMGRLSLDHEAVAMRSSGVSLAQNLRPVMVLSTALVVATAAVSLWGQPASARAFQRVLYESVKNRIGLTTQTGVFTEIARGVTAYAGEVRDGGKELGDLFLYLEKGPGGGVWILARSGRMWDEGGRLALDLRDGEMHQGGGPGQPYRRLRFRHYLLRVPLPARAVSTDVEGMGSGRLAALARTGDRGARYELHRRLALPAICWVFGVLGVCLGLHHSRFGRGRGLTLGLVTILVYYALLTAGKALGKRSPVPPEAAAWLPDLALALLALYAFARKNREAPLPLEEAAAAALTRAVGLLRRIRP